MKILRAIFSLLFSVCFCAFAEAQVLINEICSSNGDLVYDPQFYNFSGWVELYNAGGSSIDLGNYYLSDSETDYKWKIPPGTIITANGYLIIWCDKQNSGLHTNFSLDSDGERVVLSNPTQVLVDQIIFPKQYTNVSYGRLADGGSTIGYMTVPTFESQNNNATGTERLENPATSISSGRYSAGQSVVLSHLNAAATVRYTTDGSEPMPTSAAYNTPINISTTTTLKAKAFASGFLPSKTEVHTYFINEHIFSLPVVSISTNPDYLWDNSIGIYVEGTNGVAGMCSSSPVNWNQDWDRHAIIEYFDASGNKEFDQGVDIRIGGNCTRRYDQKSLVVSADDKYGKNNIEEKLFPNKDATRYHSFFYRNSGNDFNVTLFRDALIQHLAKSNLDVDYLDYQPTIFYLNGQYWGIQNMREKADAEFIETNYGIAESDIDLIENKNTVLNGSYSAFNSYQQTLKSMDRSSASAYTHIDNNIDVQEFINYLATEIYTCNTDWPHNNQKYWRQVSTNGKFRWILWDTDFGLGLFQGRSYPTHPTLNYVTSTNEADFGVPPWATEHIRYVLENPDFKNRFVQTFTAVMNTTFGPAYFNEQLRVFENQIKAEIPFHKTKWGGDLTDWNTQLEKTRLFIKERQRYMQQHMADFFGLGETVSLSIKANPASATSFSLNGVKSSTAFDNGVYFKGLEYTVKAEPIQGYEFDHWKITKQTTSTTSLIKIGDEWKYFDQGSLPASNWNTTAFDDIAWATGKGQFGYGDLDEKTLVSYGADANNKFVTTYFRKTISLDAAGVANLDVIKAGVNFDDGVVIYINGSEVFRSNLPTTAINYNTLATKNYPTENEYVEFSFNKNLLTTGNNVIAVEVHQSSVTSTDLTFDLQLLSNTVGSITESTTTNVELVGNANENLTFEAFYNSVPVISGIVINEIGATKSGVTDDFAEQEDWIELYNNNTSAIDLAGLYISDDPTNKSKYKIPSGDENTIMPPQTYKVLWADEQLSQGVLHVGFKLSSNGESVGLYQQVGNEVIKVDEMSFNIQLENVSYARIPNITGPFSLTTTLTPAGENVLSVVSTEGDELNDVVVFPNPTTDGVTVQSNVHVELRVFDLIGKSVYEINSDFEGTSLQVPLPSETGLYVLQIQSANSTRTIKVIKQ